MQMNKNRLLVEEERTNGWHK